MTSLPEFDGVRVLCVGDVMMDRFVQGTVKRISPESPVPIIHLGETTSVPGGAANVARNIVALGGRCTLVGAVGGDPVGIELGQLLAACAGLSPELIVDERRPTIEKIRFVAQGQHLLRADREEPGDVSTGTGQDIVARVTALIGLHDVVVLSDYAKGVLTDAVLSGVIGVARQAGVPVVVDPKSVHLERYAGATVATPNARETAAATGIDPVDDAGAEQAGRVALDRSGIEAILLTRAERGMSLIRPDRPAVHIPASAREIFDVVGAGDTVVATLSLCLGAGTGLETAARVANTAGGVVVGKHGTATISRSELLDELALQSDIGRFPPDVKVLDAEGMLARRDAWRRDGLRIGFTNGCFDILHVGHVRILEYARSQCDRLIVGVNSDASVRRLKGPTRPINIEDDRAFLLGALGCVDAVVVFDEDTPGPLIARLQPDVLVKGSDYSIDRIVGADTVLARGGQVLTFDLIPGRSTTGIIARAAAPQENMP